MWEVPLPKLEELYVDAAALQLLLDSGMLATPDQVNVANHIKGLNNSIDFIKRMGQG